MAEEKPYDAKPDLKRFLFDGMLFSIMFGLGEAYVPAYALFLGFSGVMMSYLFSFPRLLSALGQLLSGFLLHRLKSRRGLVSVLVLLQSITWILLLLCGVFRLDFWVFLGVFMAYFFFGSLAGPIWFGWIGYFVDEKERGKFFGYRNRIINFSLFFCLLFSGILINSLEGSTVLGIDGELFSYGLFFIAAFASRFYNFFLLRKIKDVTIEHSPEEQFKFSEMLYPKKHLSHEVKVLAGFAALFMFSVFIAAPYFVEYMLRILGFSYLQFISFSFAAVLVKFVVSRAAGILGDEFGHARMFMVGALIISTLTFSWFFIRYFPLLLMLDAFMTVGWALWDLFSVTLLFEYSKPKNRTLIVSWFNFVVIIGAFLGALASGLIFSVYSGISDMPFRMMFLTSAVLRVICFVGFYRVIKDIRAFKQISTDRIIMRTFRILPAEGVQSVPTVMSHVRNGFQRITKINGKLHIKRIDMEPIKNLIKPKKRSGSKAP
ncbi:MAG TPA: MFS transporter [Candidatus Woesearchaeota archaeon]|nr:MFS transporter [Candidatus Woesearchaeota archaeon]